MQTATHISLNYNFKFRMIIKTLGYNGKSMMIFVYIYVFQTLLSYEKLTTSPQ